VARPDTDLHLEQPRSSFGTWIGVVLLFALFGLIVWAVMGAMPRSDRFEQKRAQARTEKLKTSHEEHKKALEGYGWVDKEKGVVRVPVQRAMELTVAELAQRKPAPAGPVGPEGDKAGMQTTAPILPAPGAAPQAAPTTSPKAIAVEGPGSESAGQAAAAANPPNAPPGTQPGPGASPPPAPSSKTREFQQNVEPTPVQSPPGPPLPVPGTTPGATATATPGGRP
jgi:hypothetical protein